MREVRLAKTEEDVRRCYPVMAHLRPQYDARGFAAQVRLQRREGYELAFVEDDGSVAAVAGFRIMHMLHQGKLLYVDDLVTDPARRSTGLGGLLIEWLMDRARRAGCRYLDLDSGVQRFAAHRFYFEKDLHVSSFHFSVPLDRPAPTLLEMPRAATPTPSPPRPPKPRARTR